MFLCHLDDSHDDDNVLVFYRYSSNPFRVTQQKVLRSEYEHDPNYHVACKTIAKGQSEIEILQEDMYTPEEKEIYRNLPNSTSHLATVTLSLKHFLARLAGRYDRLYVVCHRAD